MKIIIFCDLHGNGDWSKHTHPRIGCCKGDIESCLEEHFDIAEAPTHAEIRRRRMIIVGPPTAGNASRLLLAIVNRRVQRKVA